MKLSEIPPATQTTLKDSATFILSSGAKRSLDLVARTKGKTISELVRDIVDDFLNKNSEEIQKLEAHRLG